MTRRAGFTLVELLVAMTLTIFVMVILTQAFVISIEVFSGLKGLGDLQTNMRVASVALQTDLKLDHFDGTRRLSDPFDPNDRPTSGFFALYQGMNSGQTSEGFDADGVQSFTATTHVLHFTVRQRGNRRENFYVTPLALPGGDNTPFYADKPFPDIQTAQDIGRCRDMAYIDAGDTASFGGQWAEVCYFLLRTGTTDEPENPNAVAVAGQSTPLYALYRAQLVITPNVGTLDYKWTGAAYQYPNVAAFPGLACNQTMRPAPSGPGGPFPAVDFYSPTDEARPTDPATGRHTRTLRLFPDPGPPAGLSPLPPSLGWDKSVSPPVVRARTAAQVTAAGAAIAAAGDPSGGSAAARVTNATLILPNVVSFHCMIFTVPPGGPAGFRDPIPDPLAAALPAAVQPRRFDTGDPTVGNFPVRAVGVTVRAWDTKTHQARQLSVAVDQ